MCAKIAKLDSQARRMAYNVIQFCDEEKRSGFKIPVDKPTERASKLLGLSRATIIRIRREGKEGQRRALEAWSENNIDVIRNADKIDTNEPLWLEDSSAEMNLRIKEEPVSDNDQQNEEASLGLYSEVESKNNSGTHNYDKEITTKIEIDESAWLVRIAQKESQIEETTVLNADLQAETKDTAFSMNEREVHFQPAESAKLHMYKCKTGASTSVANDSLDSKDYSRKRENGHTCRRSNMHEVDGSCIANTLHTEKGAHSCKSKKSYKCEICEKSFTMRSLLKKHEVIHGNERPHKCKLCEKTFIKRSHLNAHTLYHEGKRIHNCEVCNKSFISSSDLKRHSLVHEGKKPYKCEICRKNFILLSRLKEHKMTHEGEKPYKCEICEKRFMRMSDKKKHNLIHENKSERRCEICNKNFGKPSELKRHNFMHGAKKPHKCEICGKSFCRMSTLKKHSLVHTSHHS